MNLTGQLGAIHTVSAIMTVSYTTQYDARDVEPDAGIVNFYKTKVRA